MDSDLDQWIKDALLEGERNLDLPTNSLVDEVMLKPVDVKAPSSSIEKELHGDCSGLSYPTQSFCKDAKKNRGTRYLDRWADFNPHQCPRGLIDTPTKKNGSFRSHHLGKSQWPNSLHIFGKIAPKLLRHSRAHINSLTYIHCTKTFYTLYTLEKNLERSVY